MAALMDLIAGDAREVALALAVDDLAALDDPDRFVAHLALGGGLDPTWLDLFSEATRHVTRSPEPRDFIDARTELADDLPAGERLLERVDPSWIAGVAALRDADLGPVAGRWIELLDDEIGPLAREDKPWIRDLTGRIVAFARAATGASDVVFAWAL